MRVLLINTTEPQCGVYQYGLNLAAVLEHSSQIELWYGSHVTRAGFMAQYAEVSPDAVLYNWQSGVGGWMADAPFDIKAKQVLVYHDGEAHFARFDGIFFSDPTMPPHKNWHPIGRPLNYTNVSPEMPPPPEVLTIGIHGFIGAWAAWAVNYFPREVPIRVRLHLPRSPFCDPEGAAAQANESVVRATLGNCAPVEVSNGFMPWWKLIEWLRQNTINCYIREPSTVWRGVSSAPDAALVAGRPIAINRCNAFRHLHNCTPSICVEDRSISSIVESGIEPLKAKYAQFDPRTVADQIAGKLQLL
jgi:hypothetical protein